MKTRDVILILTLTLQLASVSAVSAQNTLWGMAGGDTFSVETTVEQNSTVQFGELPAMEMKTTEQIVVQYRVASAVPNGTLIQARIASARRTVGPDSDAADGEYEKLVQRLARVPLAIELDAAGVVRSVDGYDAVVQELSAADERTSRLFRQVCSRTAFAAWISQPFWITPPEDRDPGSSWERMNEVSLGLLGSLRSVLTCKVQTAEKNTLQIEITGNTRHVPPPSGNRFTEILAYEDVSVEIEAFQGAGKIVIPGVAGGDDSAGDDSADTPDTPDTPDAPEQPAEHGRPWFQSLSLDWQITGQAFVRAGGKSRKLTFQQQQKQSSRLLPGYRLRIVPRFP